MASYQYTGLVAKINADLANNSVGSISAEDVRSSMLNIVDSIIPIMASGADVHFSNDVDFRDQGVTTAGTSIGAINGQWNQNNIGAIRFITGSDTTSKDDGLISFYTSPSGASTSPTSPGLIKRMSIKPDGKVHIFGSGINPAMEVESVIGSGVNILIKGTKKSIAYPSGTAFNIGVFDAGKDRFSSRIGINSKNFVGINNEFPEEPLHIVSSGNAIRFDSRIASTDMASIMLSKYNDDWSKDQLRVGFGIGVNVESSGVGSLFIGPDTDRDNSVSFNDAVFTVNTTGNAGIRNSTPRSTLSVGQSLGEIASKENDRAIVLGALDGDTHFIMGSGTDSPAGNKYAHFKWEKSNKRLEIAAKGEYRRDNQLVLSSTANHVGIAGSGHPTQKPLPWTPSYNLHVSHSGTYANVAIENPLPQKSALYIGRNTIGSGNLEVGQWASIGYKAASDVLKINNSGSLSSSHLALTKLGNVGINTDAPYDSMSIGNNRLHVYGDNTAILVGDISGLNNSAVRILGSRTTNDSGYIQTGTNAADTTAKLKFTRMDTDNTNMSEIDFYSDTSTYHGNIALNGNWLSNSAVSSGVKITDIGNVGINVASPAYELQLSSNSAAKPISSVWDVVSDSRVKTDVSTISEALDKISNLRPVKFKYTHDFCHCDDSGEINEDTYYYNFIAQEVEVEFPEAVRSAGFNVRDDDTGDIIVDNVKTLDAHIINVYLVKAVQELKIELDAAKARITQLES